MEALIYTVLAVVLPFAGCIDNINPYMFLNEWVLDATYYPYTSGVSRFVVPDDKKSWNVTWKEYKPRFFTSDTIKTESVDPNCGRNKKFYNFNPKFNSLDGEIDRRSFTGEYEVVKGFPINPRGRTGVAGRGMLTRWGPNHEVVLIISRWKLSRKRNLVFDYKTKKQYLEVFMHKWGGECTWSFATECVRDNEDVVETVKRTYYNNLLNHKLLEEKGFDLNDVKNKSEQIFQNGQEIFRGLLKDARNTDNAWVESVVMHFSDDKYYIKWPLIPGPVSGMVVRWVDATRLNPVFAGHAKLLKTVVKMRNAHW